MLIFKLIGQGLLTLGPLTRPTTNRSILVNRYNLLWFAWFQDTFPPPLVFAGSLILLTSIFWNKILPVWVSTCPWIPFFSFMGKSSDSHFSTICFLLMALAVEWVLWALIVSLSVDFNRVLSLHLEIPEAHLLSYQRQNSCWKWTKETEGNATHLSRL